MHTMRMWLAKMHVHQLIPTMLGLASIVIVGVAALSAAGKAPNAGLAPTSIGGTRIVISACPRLMYATAHPISVTALPMQLPCNGLNVNEGLAILLPPGNATPTVTAAQIINRLKPRAVFPITQMILVNLTSPGTIPLGPPEPIPGTTQPVQWNPIVDRLAWLVVETFPHPIDVKVGGPGHHTPLYRSRFCLAIDARTGARLYGFYTN